MSEAALWKSILQACDTSDVKGIGDSIAVALRAELAVLSAGGQTDAQQVTALLSTYGPALTALCVCRATAQEMTNRKLEAARALREGLTGNLLN